MQVLMARTHQNKIRQEDEQDSHPRITQVKYKVENKLNKNIFSFKVIWQGRVTENFFSVEKTRQV